MDLATALEFACEVSSFDMVTIVFLKDGFYDFCLAENYRQYCGKIIGSYFAGEFIGH